MRKFAIIHTDENNDISNTIKNIGNEAEIDVFCFKGTEFDHPSNVSTVEIPEELRDRTASIKNFVSKHYIDIGYKGFLHVLEDSLEMLKENPVEFYDAIEEMMTKLGLKSWFNTVTDVCNYTFKIYNPRIKVMIDKEDARKVYDKSINWTSHANTFYVIYDMSVAEYEDIRFEDRFTIPMFFIIEFLARRRNTKKSGELNYMNFYPSIQEEIGVFRAKPEKYPPIEKTEQQKKTENETYEKENRLYKELNVDNSADVSVETIIEDMYNHLVRHS